MTATTLNGVLLTGSHASRPAATAVAKGTIYSCTTHSLVYQSDASSWSTWATLGSGTTVATDTIWDAAGDLAVGSGADTAAKLAKGNAGAVLAMGNSAVIWNGGTSFPGSKATNDRYWRTDLGSEYYWDGTRWLSTVARTMPFVFSTNPPLAATGIPQLGIMPTVLGGSDVWLSGFSLSFYVQGGTALSGSHKWDLSLEKLNTAGASVLGTATINSGASDQWRQGGYVTVGAAAAAVSSSYVAFQASWTKTGTPGSLWALISVDYRLIAT